MQHSSRDTVAAEPAPPKHLAFFERYLTLWVFLCMVVGVALGKLLPEATAARALVEARACCC